MEDDDPAFTSSAKFKQRVNFGESSVHIPVEIYEGSKYFSNYFDQDV